MPAFFCLCQSNLHGVVDDSPVRQAINGERLYRAVIHHSFPQQAQQ